MDNTKTLWNRRLAARKALIVFLRGQNGRSSRSKTLATLAQDHGADTAKWIVDSMIGADRIAVEKSWGDDTLWIRAEFV